MRDLFLVKLCNYMLVFGRLDKIHKSLQNQVVSIISTIRLTQAFSFLHSSQRDH